MTRPSFAPLAATVLTLAVASAGYGQIGLFWSPPSVSLTVPPGGTGGFRCDLLNNGIKTQRFQIQVLSLSQRLDGSYQFEPSEKPAPETSCAGWISFEPRELTLDAGQSASVMCSVKVPRGTRGGGRYAAVVCQLLPETGAQGSGTAHMQITVNTATIVMLAVGARRSTVKAKLSTFEVRPAPADEGGGLWFEAALANQGNIHLFGKGRLIVRTTTGRRLAETQLGGGRGTVLPGATVRFRTLIRERLPIGAYVAEAVISYGGRGPAVARVPFQVSRAALLGSMVEGLAVAIEPQPLSATVPPGGTRTLSAAVYNQEDRSVHIKAHTADLTQDSLGHLAPAEEGEPVAPSAASWTTLKLTEFDLAPGEHRTIPVVVSVPRDQEPMGRYAALVAQATTGPRGEANAIEFAPLLLTVAGQVVRKVDVTKIELIPRSGSPPAFRVTVANRGKVHVPLLRATVSVIETSPALAKKSWSAAHQFTDEVLLPGAERTVTIGLDEQLPVGSYRADGMVAFGTTEPARQSLDFDVRKGQLSPQPKPGGPRT